MTLLNKTNYIKNGSITKQGILFFDMIFSSITDTIISSENLYDTKEGILVSDQKELEICAGDFSCFRSGEYNCGLTGADHQYDRTVYPNKDRVYFLLFGLLQCETGEEPRQAGLIALYVCKEFYQQKPEWKQGNYKKKLIKYIYRKLCQLKKELKLLYYNFID